MRKVLKVLCLIIPWILSASEVDISEGRVHIIDDRAYVDFQISWNLSWHNEVNWDAAWVFGKNQSDGFKHIEWVNRSGKSLERLQGTSSDATIKMARDQKGAFIYRRSTSVEREINNWMIRLEWDYKASDYELKDLPETLHLYAIEMVFIPQGPFELGDPQGVDGPDNAFFALSADSTGTYRVESSNAISVCEGPNSLCYENKFGIGRGGDQKGPIPASFPNGYDAFYIMKYKVTQGQYAALLNTLTDLQSANRSILGSRDYSERGTIRLVSGKYVAHNPDRACHYLGWEDDALFADWAALRPYTELEYEKACRGPEKAVSDEYAWGTVNIVHGDTIFNPNGIKALKENGDEFIRGNANYRPMDRDFSIESEVVFVGGDGGRGPLRVDIFETRAFQSKGDITREAAGASYYGVMGLTGGLFERVVSVGHPRGRSFLGSHGDGSVNYEGEADNILEDWPAQNGEGLGLRARNWAFDTRKLQMANRGFGQYTGTYRSHGMGFRAARTVEEQ